MQVALLRRFSWVLMVLLGATAATQSAASPAAVGMPLVLEQCSPVFDPRQQYTFSRVPPYTNPAAVQRYGGCFDLSTDCAQWAKGDQCKANPGFMKDNCPKSCGLCTTAGKHTHGPNDTARMMYTHTHTHTHTHTLFALP